jgi:nucleotide-binding universal stress UspA family protein
MNADRILLPIDLARCPLDVLPLVNRLVDHSNEVTVILLHVLNLNILTPETRIYDGLCDNARQRLQRLTREQVHPLVDTCVRVRVGDPFEEIVAEAREQQVQLIILPTFEHSFWRRLFTPMVPRVAEKLARRAPCPVYAVRVEKAFDCEAHWASEPRAAANGKTGHIASEFVPGGSRQASFARTCSNETSRV